MKNQKKLIILTGPSGVGKGTVVKEIWGKEKNFWLSISATTREPREGEKDGVNYYFLNQEKFKDMIKQNLFLEWAQFAGNYYGTPFSSVNEKIKKGFTVLLEIEVEGARQIKNKFPNSQSIFLLPPDKEELERRIRNRGTEKEEAIEKRLSRANYEISVSNQFDFALTNHNIDETAKKIIKLIKTWLFSIYQLIGWNNKSGKNLLNSIIIPAVRLSQIAATTGADLTNFVFRILNICFIKVF